MNYIREINAFIDWLETNPLEASTQTLWFHLMGIANKSGWPEWFTVANLTLQAKVGVTENTLLKHRNFLIQRGRIEYRNQGKQKAGKYHLIPFTSIFEVNNAVKYAVNHEVNHGVKGDPLLKLNDSFFTTPATTDNDYDISRSSSAPLYEPTDEDNMSIADIHTKVFGTMFMTPLMTDFVKKLSSDCSEYFVKEIMLEAGESANKPSIRYMQSTAERWIKEGINSRKESKDRNAAEQDIKNKGQPDKQTIYKLYRQKIGEVSFDIKNMIDRWVENYSENWARKALESENHPTNCDAGDISLMLKMWEKSGLEEPWKIKSAGEYHATAPRSS